jgi:delta24-sterol reductase
MASRSDTSAHPGSRRLPSRPARTESGPAPRPSRAAREPSAPNSLPPIFGDMLTELLVKHRWATVVPLVLPLSKAYETYWQLRHVKLRNLLARPEQHAARVAGVQQQVRDFIAAGRPGKLCTSRKGWQSVSVRDLDYKRANRSVNLELSDILALDTERRVLRVEPRANMGQITAFLNPKGWTLPVIPELDDLTVGGLVLGYGIESSAHQYGLFADTILAAEVVVADGSVVRCSRDENPDLFHALSFSYGAHGLLTAVELPVVPCKPYVKITYHPVRSLEEASAKFSALVCDERPSEFVDGLMFSRERGVLMEANFADLPPGEQPNDIGRYYKPWFYKHAESFIDSGTASEYIPLRQYYHRYTRSLYWHGELLVPFGNHPLFRYTLGWLMPPKVSFMRLTQTERLRKYRDERNVVQDALVPIRELEPCLELFHQLFDCYPLWFCAHKLFKTQPQGMLSPSSPELDEEMFADVGAWQVPGFVKRKEAWSGTEAVKRMEAWLREHHGYQCLYAVTEQTREQFWQMFDRTLYDRVRAKYGSASTFMDTFDKVAKPDRR